MNTIIRMLGMLFLISVLASCHKDTIPIYQLPTDNKDSLLHQQNRDNVYFGFSDDKQRDSVTYTFAYTPDLKTDTFYLPIRISGNRSSKSMTFKVAVTDSSTTAVAGLDYVPLQEVYSIPADSGFAWLPVILLNKDTLLSYHSVTLCLHLVASTDLNVQLADIVSARIIFSNKLEKPDWWDTWLTNYSDEKFQLFIDATNGVTQLANGADHGLYAPQSLYYIGLMNNLINDPFSWVTQNSDRGYVLQQQPDGSYIFYNPAIPATRLQVVFNTSANKYLFVQKIGGYVTPN